MEARDPAQISRLAWFAGSSGLFRQKETVRPPTFRLYDPENEIPSRPGIFPPEWFLHGGFGRLFRRQLSDPYCPGCRPSRSDNGLRIPVPPAWPPRRPFRFHCHRDGAECKALFCFEKYPEATEAASTFRFKFSICFLLFHLFFMFIINKEFPKSNHKNKTFSQNFTCIFPVFRYSIYLTMICLIDKERCTTPIFTPFPHKLMK